MLLRTVVAANFPPFTQGFRGSRSPSPTQVAWNTPSITARY